MASAAVTDGTPEITLRDVILHMQHMEQRLMTLISANTTAIQKIDHRLTARMDKLEYNLTIRMDALEEDLTATMKDTFLIRQHVGLSTED